MAGKVLFLCVKCALDDRSGAAHSVRNILRALAEAGWDAKSLTMTLFDGQAEYPRQKLLGAQNAVPESEGQLFRLHRHGVEHTMFYTHSTVDRNLTKKEAQGFYQQAKSFLQKEQPDVIVMFGQSPLCRHLINLAGSVCRSLVFYLANPSYTSAELFEPFDQIFMPSNFLAEYYQEKIGIQGEVIRTPVAPEQHVMPHEVLGVRNIEARKHGFITFMNPSLPKGGALFGRLVTMAERERPDLLFLGVEGRMTDEDWARAGLDLANLRNLWWIPNQDYVRSIYERTSVLLFPSFWVEPSGRSIAEAQLGGIPVLGSNHSGIPEQLNGGGVLFDIPERCREKFSEVPTEEEVRPWLDIIYKLMDDDQCYQEATNWALRGSSIFQPERVKQEIIDYFENLPDTHEKRTQVRTTMPSNNNEDQASSGNKIGRNAQCPCGSGRKVKNCCKEKVEA